VCINTILLLLKIKYSKDPISWSFFTDCFLNPNTGFILNFSLVCIFRFHYFYYDVMQYLSSTLSISMANGEREIVYLYP
jgi:hypothetical protein